MPDNHTPEQRHLNMAAIHSSSTKPELYLRKALWRHGFRYHVNDKRLPGKPDIVLPKYRTVIFIHGCFWHGHKGCKYYAVPKTNTDYWVAKVARNQERDQEVWRQLEAKGWYVIIVWECELTKVKLQDTVDRIIKDLHNNRVSFLAFQEERRVARVKYRQERMEQKSKTEALMAESKRVLLG